MCVPILSHNSQTNNLLLKITVPKRTGRKRKLGSQDPYMDAIVGDPAAGEDGNGPPRSDNLRSQARRDNPVELLRILKDNVSKYTVEAVAEIGQTHRFRGKVLIRDGSG
jgi:general transcription factor 3C polypeptide 5 (transcription factor C subunit 1)